MRLRSLFKPDWPRYAVAAHLLFWSASALFLISCVAGYNMGLVGVQLVISLFWATMFVGFLLGLAGAASGFLYVGNQVFRRTPLTGWFARLYGMAVSASTLMFLFFAYALKVHW